MTPFDAGAVDFEKDGGLVPAIAQDCDTLQVLMLGYMDRAALDETLASGEATFFSRSRGGRWRKGETSGNRLRLVSIAADCDSDAILLMVRPVGPACHRGAPSCFGEQAAIGVGRLALLERTIRERSNADPSTSWTARLIAEGPKRIAQKVGEEGVETALAGAVGDHGELCAEAADLLYHLTVLLHTRGLSLNAVMEVLRAREK
jgi:phosphoribosyl-ATP pyrophosphohydrolase/phosphoribosyl-AMP cyclohydrolase